MFFVDTRNNHSIDIEGERWLEGLMDEYGDRLTKLAYSYLKDWGRAQEVVQDVFIICYKKRTHILQITSLDAWIYRVTVNRCKDMLRTTWLKRVIVNQELFQFRKSEDLLPETELLTNADNENLANRILQLPTKYKEVILLFYYEDLSVREMSYILKTNENTIKTRLKRGRNLLKKRLKEGGDYFE